MASHLDRPGRSSAAVGDDAKQKLCILLHDGQQLCILLHDGQQLCCILLQDGQQDGLQQQLCIKQDGQQLCTKLVDFAVTWPPD